MDNLVEKKNVAVILARQGSKRIPKKNIVDFHNKPLIYWTIKAALEANLFNNIIVSTDSNEIREMSIKFGAEVPFLREKYCDDHASSSMATLQTLEQCKKELGFEFENVFQLMPNCPIRSSKEIVTAFDNFSKKNAVSQISCTNFGWLNPWWAIKLEKNGFGDPLFPKEFNERSQDQEKLYGISGAVWIAKSFVLEKYKTFYCPGHIFFPMSWHSAFDIDTQDDLEIAKSIFKKENQNAI